MNGRFTIDGKPATLDEFTKVFKEGQHLRRLGQFAAISILGRAYPSPLLESDLNPKERTLLPMLVSRGALREIKVEGYSGQAYELTETTVAALDLLAMTLALPRVNQEFEAQMV